MAPSPTRIRPSSSSLRSRFKKIPLSFVLRARAEERGFVAVVSTHLSESPPRELAPGTRFLHLAGCRGFSGPVPPPLSMSAVPKTARQLHHDLEAIAILDPRARRPRISPGSRAEHLAATLSLPRGEVSAHREKT